MSRAHGQAGELAGERRRSAEAGSAATQRNVDDQEFSGQVSGNQVQSGQVTVVNKRGLHARAAAKFVKLAGSFSATVRVSATNCVGTEGTYVSGRSIMGLMMLGAGPGSRLCIEAEGTDAPPALAALMKLVEGGFDEGE